jgi:hypothetical protein
MIGLSLRRLEQRGRFPARLSPNFRASMASIFGLPGATAAIAEAVEMSRDRKPVGKARQGRAMKDEGQGS